MCVCVVMPNVCFAHGGQVLSALVQAYHYHLHILLLSLLLSLSEDVGCRIKSVMLSNPAGKLHDFSPSPLLQQGAEERGVGEEWPVFALMTGEIHELHTMMIMCSSMI